LDSELINYYFIIRDSIVYINFAPISYLPYNNALKNNIIRYYIRIFFYVKKELFIFVLLLELRIIDNTNDIDIYPCFETDATSTFRPPNHPMRICCTKPASDPLRLDSSAIFCPATVLLFWEWLYAIMRVMQTNR